MILISTRNKFLLDKRLKSLYLELHLFRLKIIRKCPDILSWKISKVIHCIKIVFVFCVSSLSCWEACSSLGMRDNVLRAEQFIHGV